MAAVGTSVKQAAALLKTSPEAIEVKARRLGITVRGGSLVKRHAGPATTEEMTASERYSMVLLVTGIFAVWGGALWLVVKLFWV